MCDLYDLGHLGQRSRRQPKCRWVNIEFDTFLRNTEGSRFTGLVYAVAVIP